MTRPPEPPRLLTTAEVAEILRINYYQAVILCRSGAIRASKPAMTDGRLGKSWRVSLEDLNEYIAKGYDAQKKAAS